MGTADDPDGDGGRPWRGRRFGPRKKSLAGDPAGTGDIGMVEDRLQTLVKRAWRATLAGTADDPGGGGRRTTVAGTALWHSQKELGGRAQTTLARTADDTLQTLVKRGGLAGTAPWHSQNLAGDPGGDGGRP